MTKFRPFGAFGGPTQRAVLPLIRQVGKDIQPVGTGFMVNPNGIMITAAHVARELAMNESREPINVTLDPDIICSALYASNEKDPNTGIEIGGLLHVAKIWYPPALDIAFVQVHVPQKVDGSGALQIPIVRLTAQVPRIGEHVLGVGYYRMDGRLSDKTTTGHDMSFAQETALSDGVVSEVHGEYRDLSMLNFPCFRTDCRFDGGMSGGPVLNQRGCVCGVICSSLGGDESTGYTSYASLMWPAFAGALELSLDGAPARWVTLYEMACRNFVNMDESISRLRLEGDPSTTRSISLLNEGYEPPPSLGG